MFLKCKFDFFALKIVWFIQNNKAWSILPLYIGCQSSLLSHYGASYIIIDYYIYYLYLVNVCFENLHWPSNNGDGYFYAYIIIKKKNKQNLDFGIIYFKKCTIWYI